MVKIENPYKNLYLVNLDQKELVGFRQFISTWVYNGPKTNFIVDPGPSNTIPLVLEALKKIEVNRLDYIFLTHIHLDHAGGAGILLKYFPDAEIICHSKGIPHLIDPVRLYEGSVKILGKIAETFGPPIPVPDTKIINLASANIPEGIIEIFPTPGHASHHQSFFFNGLLFCGEATGTAIPMKKGDYLRLATPPVFKYEVFKESIRKSQEYKPQNLCLAHFGFRNDPDSVFESALQQLDFWISILSNLLKNDDFDFGVALKTLQRSDPNMINFGLLPGDIREREIYFSINSLKGIASYIRGTS